MNINDIKILEAAAAPNIEGLALQVRAGIDEKGVVLVRGFDPRLAPFEDLTRKLCSRFHNAGTRHKIREEGTDPFTTRAFVQNCTILAHSEGAYTPTVGGKPEVAFFMCDTAPSCAGGETTVTDGAEFLARIPKEWQTLFEGGIIHEKVYAKPRWQGEFMLETEEQLKAYLDQFKSVAYKLHGDSLQIFYLSPAITVSRTGQKVFANGLLAHLKHVTNQRYNNKALITNPTNGTYFANKVPIGDEIISGLIDIYDSINYPHVWQKGDILVLDNGRYMHGRTPTVEPCERVLITRFGWLK